MMKRSDPLRPERLDDFVGQREIVERLRVILTAANMRAELPDHLLFSGPPGCGKTTLANIVANELGLPLVTTTGPTLEKPSDLVHLLVMLQVPSVVFIDEIHAINTSIEEIIYPALEDGVVDILVDTAAGETRTHRISLQPFCLVGATTKAGNLSAPLRDRFGYHGRLEFYTVEELGGIVQQSAKKLGLRIDDDAAAAIASRSRGTPRIANTLLRRVRDWVTVQTGTTDLDFIGVDATEAALDAFGVDALGLDHVGREILRVLATHRNGEPVGLSTLAAAVGEPQQTIEDIYEPHLIRTGLIARTSRGRIITPAGAAHIGIDVDDNRLPGLAI